MTISLVNVEEYYINPEAIAFISPVYQYERESENKYYYVIHLEKETITARYSSKELAEKSRESFVKSITTERK